MENRINIFDLCISFFNVDFRIYLYLRENRIFLLIEIYSHNVGKSYFHNELYFYFFKYELKQAYKKIINKLSLINKNWKVK